MERLRISRILMVAIVSVLFPSISYAQTETDYSQVQITAEPDELLVQHWAMPTLTNPAAAAADTTLIRIRGGARIDYLGSHQSPKNFLVAADAPFKLMGKHIGAGVLVNSNSYYLYRNLMVGAQGSYKFMFGKSVLSVGVQLGYFHSKFKGSEMVINTGGSGDNTGSGTPGEGPGEGEAEGDNTSPGDDLPDDDYPYDQELPTHDVAGGTFDMAV